MKMVCAAAAAAATAFTGTVVDIRVMPAEFPVDATASQNRLASRQSTDPMRVKLEFRVIKLRVDRRHLSAPTSPLSPNVDEQRNV